MESRALTQKNKSAEGKKKKEWHNGGEVVNKRGRQDVWAEIETKMRKADQ